MVLFAFLGGLWAGVQEHPGKGPTIYIRASGMGFGVIAVLALMGVYYQNDRENMRSLYDGMSGLQGAGIVLIIPFGSLAVASFTTAFRRHLDPTFATAMFPTRSIPQPDRWPRYPHVLAVHHAIIVANKA